MPSIKVLNQNGAEVSTLELDESVFGAEYHQVADALNTGHRLSDVGVNIV